jgi:subtilisin-like proprotein convertase family protein
MQIKRYFTTLLCCCSLLSNGQSYYRTSSVTIPGNGQTITDTLNVSALSTATLNNSFGLDSISLRLNYNYDEDLLISLTAPDGTVLQLANNLGGNGDNFTNTRFTMSVNDLINLSSPPFTGKMRPESWMGRVNNGQNGNGKWVMKIKNTATTANSGMLLKWGLHFDNTPAPPEFFTTSALPIVVVNTNNIVPQHNIKNEVVGTMGIIDNPGSINTIGNAFNGYNGNINIKVRGNSSAGFAQKSYTVTTTLANGDDNNVSVLGMSTGSSWVLYGAWDDKSIIRNILTYQLSNEMGAYASRTHLCELVLNGDYKGVYVFMEKIKRDTARVDVEKISTSTVSGPDLTGGYIFQVDRGESATDHWTSNYPPCAGSNGDISFVYEYPSESKINTAQKAYLAGYVDSFEAALANQNLYDTILGYRRFIDVKSFIEQSILQELGHNVDGYRLSSFLHKGKNKKLSAGPAWDFNLAFGNADYYNGSATDNFEWDMPCPFNDGNLNPFWWKKMVTDTTYLNDYKCRYTNLRQTVLDTLHIDHVLDSLRNVLLIPQSRNFTRWPILGIYLWPNEYVGNTWQDEMSYLRNWIHTRIRWMDTKLYQVSCLPTVPPPPPLSVNEADKASLVQLYPNPVNEVLNIDGKGVIIKQVRIFNMTGQLLLDERTDQAFIQIHLKDKSIAAGIYTVNIETNKGIVRKKLVIR